VRKRYIVYAVLVSVVATIFSWGGMLRSSTSSGSSYVGGSTYSPGHAGGGSWGGGSGGHK